MCFLAQHMLAFKTRWRLLLIWLIYDLKSYRRKNTNHHILSCQRLSLYVGSLNLGFFFSFFLRLHNALASWKTPWYLLWVTIHLLFQDDTNKESMHIQYIYMQSLVLWMVIGTLLYWVISSMLLCSCYYCSLSKLFSLKKKIYIAQALLNKLHCIWSIISVCSKFFVQ